MFEFNQVVIFVKTVQRCVALCKLLNEQKFPAISIHRAMTQEERLKKYTNGDNHKRYYEKHKEKYKELGSNYLQKLKEDNPEKLKEYRQRAYQKRKEKMKQEAENI